MTKSEKPSPRVVISARDLKDIIRDELYDLQAAMEHARGPEDTEFLLPNERVKEIARTIVNRALLSPR